MMSAFASGPADIIFVAKVFFFFPLLIYKQAKAKKKEKEKKIRKYTVTNFISLKHNTLG